MAASANDDVRAAPPPVSSQDSSAAGEFDSLAARDQNLDVRVVGSDGQPIGNAWVEVRQRRDGDDCVTQERTGRDGCLRVSVRGQSVGFIAWKEAAVSPIERIDLPHAAAVVLELERGIELRGRVVERSSGRPVALAYVALWTHAETDSVETNASGTFVHPRIPRGGPSQQLRVIAPGFAASVQYLSVDEGGAWELLGPDGHATHSGLASPAEVTLELRREKRIFGRVVDALGKPVSGAIVEALGHVVALPGVATRDYGSAVTDANGEFAVSGMDADVRHHLSISADGWARAFGEGPPGTEADLGRVELRNQAFLLGIVVDTLGRPARNVRVVVRPLADLPGSWTSIEKSGWRQVREAAISTDPDGRFELAGLDLQRYSLRVRRAGATLASAEALAVHDPFEAALELVVEERWSTLGGEVRDADGRAAAGARVTVRRRGRELAQVHADAAGRFYVTGLDAESQYDLDAVGRCGARGHADGVGIQGGTTLFLEGERTSAESR